MNGRVEFDAGGVRLDGLSGRMGGGEVKFGGRVGLKGTQVESYAVTAVGREMRVRYPEGFRSLIDADLALRGAATNPILTGTVQVRDALWVRSIETEGTGIFGLAAGGAGKSGGGGGGLGGGWRAARPRRAGVGVPDALRRAAGCAVDLEDREQQRAPRVERGADAARHLRSSAAVRPRGDQSRRGAVRRQPLSW